MASTNPFEDVNKRGKPQKSRNPFDEESGNSSSIPRSRSRSSSYTKRRNPSFDFQNPETAHETLTSQPPIFQARNVEWPIPTSLPPEIYRKLLRQSRQHSSDGSSPDPDLDEPLEEASQSTSGGTSFAGLMSRVVPSMSQMVGGPSEPVIDSSRRTEGLVPFEALGVKAPARRCVASSNGWIAAVMECYGDTSRTVPLKVISRWNVRRGRPTDPWELLTPLPCRCGTVWGVFVDPTGHHTFLSMSNGEAYHLHSSSKRIRKLGGFGLSDKNTLENPRGVSPGSHISSIGWDRERGTEGSTKRILLGTSVGEIYEYSLLNPEEDKDSEENEGRFPVLLCVLPSSEEDASGMVSGLHFERSNQSGMVVLAVSSGKHHKTRVHTFRGEGDALRSAFFGVGDGNSSKNMTFVELPGDIDLADLKVCGDSFGLRTEGGIYFGNIGNNSFNPSKGLGEGILPYDSNNLPVSIALTPHHFISLSMEGEVCFINRVSRKIIQRERLDWVANAIGMGMGDDTGDMELLMDIRRPDQVWLRQSQTLLHISSSCEDRDEWRYTLEKCIHTTQQRSRNKSPHPNNKSEEKAQDAHFEIAKSLCANSNQKAVVQAVRSEYHLQQGHADLAAKYFAQVPPILAPFSTTALRLALPSLGLPGPSGVAQAPPQTSNSSLITYLTDKLRLSAAKQDSVQCAMLGAWLVELHLHEKTSHDRRPRHDLTAFLADHGSHLDAPTTLRVLASHDARASDCAPFSAACGDVGSAVNAALSVAGREGAVRALEVLNAAGMERAEHHYYRHAAALLGRAPVQASRSFLSRYQHGLRPTKLLPAFMHYERRRKETAPQVDPIHEDRDPLSHLSKRHAKNDSDSAFQAIRVQRSKSFNNDGIEIHFSDSPSKQIPTLNFIDDATAVVKYLEGVIKMKCTSTAIYNYLVSLYAHMEDESPLFRFLTLNINAQTPLDMSYALRAILKTGRHFRSAVKLYTGFGLRQQAVELALKVDPALARELARESVDPDERKRLWLMIARNAAEDAPQDQIVQQVLSVIRDCGEDVLGIENVLPFLPDFAQIDQFKTEICAALTGYSEKIDCHLGEMAECDRSCDALREEIDRLEKYDFRLRADARCAFTDKVVLEEDEAFYVFPSGYVALETPLKEQVMPFFNEVQRERLRSLEGERGRLKRKKELSKEEIYRWEELQAEMDGLIAAECPLTGSVMVESIDASFTDCFEEDERYEKFWKEKQRVKMMASNAAADDGVVA